MSEQWRPYVNALVGDRLTITGGAIYGQGAVPVLWAETPNFIKPEEVKALVAALTDETKFNELSRLGFRIDDQKFMKIGSELNRVIRGKRGEMAAAAVLSKKAVVITVGKGSPADISVAAEKMAAELSSRGY